MLAMKGDRLVTEVLSKAFYKPKQEIIEKTLKCEKFFQELPIKVCKSKGKFTFQSTVRQVQRRKIAEKLSKEAEEMEAQRLSELEVMRKYDKSNY